MLLDIFHLGFGRYYGKVLTEPTIYHLFWAPALINVSSIFFARLPVVNNSRSKKATNIFVMLNWFWDNYFLYIFHKKSVILDQAYSFKNTELLTITNSEDTLWYSNVLLNPVQKGKPFWYWLSGNMTTYDNQDIVVVLLGYKYASVLLPKPIYKELLL